MSRFLVNNQAGSERVSEAESVAESGRHAIGGRRSGAWWSRHGISAVSSLSDGLFRCNTVEFLGSESIAIPVSLNGFHGAGRRGLAWHPFDLIQLVFGALDAILKSEFQGPYGRENMAAGWAAERALRPVVRPTHATMTVFTFSPYFTWEFLLESHQQYRFTISIANFDWQRKRFISIKFVFL